MDPYLLKRLWRRPWLSACTLILCAVLCFLLIFLTNYQQSQIAQLDQVKQSYDILCVVTSRQGMNSNSLRQSNEAVLCAQDQSEDGLGQYIRDLRITKEYIYSAPALGIKEQMLIGVTNERCVEQLNPAMGRTVTYFTKDFYDQDGYQCIVSEELYSTLEETTIQLFIEDPFVSSQIYIGTGVINFQVVGYYTGGGNQIYMTFSASQRLADEICGGLRSFDSMSFLAADNQQLDKIRKANPSIFALENASPNWPALGIMIHDKQYLATVAALEQNIQRTGYLLPLVAVLSLGIGFLISFLATRGEQRTYALMRTLGMTRGKLVASIVREQMLLPLLAVVILALATSSPKPAGFYLGCYVVGCCIAVLRSIRSAPTAILREQE